MKTLVPCPHCPDDGALTLLELERFDELDGKLYLGCSKCGQWDAVDELVLPPLTHWTEYPLTKGPAS